MLNESKQTPNGGKRNTRVFWFALLGLALFFAVSYTGRLFERAHMQAQVAQWEQRIDDAHARQSELVAQRNFVRSDAYIAWVAREQLGLAQEHDNVVIVVTDESSGPAAADDGSTVAGRLVDVGTDAGLETTSALPAESLPLWRQWLAQLLGDSVRVSTPER